MHLIYSSYFERLKVKIILGSPYLYSNQDNNMKGHCAQLLQICFVRIKKVEDNEADVVDERDIMFDKTPL